VGGIDFSSPPTDGAIVTVSWKTDEQKILKYAASISDARHPVAWTVKDNINGVVVPADWDLKVLTFSPDQVIEGRVVVVNVDFGAKSAKRTVDLPDERIDDQLTILADAKSDVCEAVPSQAVSSAALADDEGKDKPWKSRYKGREVSMKCQDGVEYAELKVEYRHEVSRTNKFVVKLPPGVEPDDPMLGWKVYVDGKLITGFKRVGSEVELEDDLLPPETRVDVEVITYSRFEK
jgi:hypothetical protein